MNNNYHKLRKIIREEVKNIIKESSSQPIDSQYLQDQLRIALEDGYFDREYEVVDHVIHRLYQTYPMGDVTKEDIYAILSEPLGRDIVRSAGITDTYRLVKDMWDIAFM